jgi:hypothetical protein
VDADKRDKMRMRTKGIKWDKKDKMRTKRIKCGQCCASYFTNSRIFHIQMKNEIHLQLQVYRSIYTVSPVEVHRYNDWTQFLVYDYLYEILRTVFFGSGLYHATF